MVTRPRDQRHRINESDAFPASLVATSGARKQPAQCVTARPQLGPQPRASLRDGHLPRWSGPKIIEPVTSGRDRHASHDRVSESFRRQDVSHCRTFA